MPCPTPFEHASKGVPASAPALLLAAGAGALALEPCSRRCTSSASGQVQQAPNLNSAFRDTVRSVRSSSAFCAAARHAQCWHMQA